MLFGRERTGLDNEDVVRADAIVTVPANPGFSSLNLGQSVLLFAYEWYQAGGPKLEGPAYRKGPGSELASREALAGLFEHLERELDAAEFLFPPAKRETMVRNIRAMIMRSGLTDQEARTIRGMIVALVRNKYRGQK